MFRMVHVNHNVADLERAVAFYRDALGLTEVRRKEKESFSICYLADETKAFQLELTWLHDRAGAYDLGDNEFHLAFETDDMEGAYAKHKAMGCVCYENMAMGVYFISDPDGYWLEIVPKKG